MNGEAYPFEVIAAAMLDHDVILTARKAVPRAFCNMRLKVN